MISNKKHPINTDKPMVAKIEAILDTDAELETKSWPIKIATSTHTTK